MVCVVFLSLSLVVLSFSWTFYSSGWDLLLLFFSDVGFMCLSGSLLVQSLRFQLTALCVFHWWLISRLSSRVVVQGRRRLCGKVRAMSDRSILHSGRRLRRCAVYAAGRHWCEMICLPLASTSSMSVYLYYSSYFSPQEVACHQLPTLYFARLVCRVCIYSNHCFCAAISRLTTFSLMTASLTGRRLRNMCRDTWTDKSKGIAYWKSNDASLDGCHVRKRQDGDNPMDGFGWASCAYVSSWTKIPQILYCLAI